MRTLLLICILLFTFALPTFAQAPPPDPVTTSALDYAVDLATIPGVIALILLLTGWVKTVLKLEGNIVQWVSHGIGLILSLVCYFFDIGIYAEMTFLLAILTGILCTLSANGAFTYDKVKYILSLFKAQILKE